MTQLHARATASTTYDDAAALVGRGPRGLLGLDLGVLRASARRLRQGARRRASMPGAAVVPGRAGQLRRARVPRQARRRAWRSCTRGELREQAELDLGRAARAGRGGSRPGCARWASSAATASPPTCRTSPRRSPPSWPRASIGAVWSSCSPDFGARSVIDRFAQIEPKVLLAVDGYRYNGKRLRPLARPSRHPRRGRRRAACARLPRRLGLAGRLPAATPSSSSSASRSTTRCGSCTPPARPACRRRSSRARAASCSSTSRSCTCTSTRRRATASSGSRRPAG